MRQVIIGPFHGTFDYVLYANREAMAPALDDIKTISERQKGATLQQAMSLAVLQSGYHPLSRTEQIALLKESITEKKDLRTEGFFDMLLEWMQFNQKQCIGFETIETHDPILKECIDIVQRYETLRDNGHFSDLAVNLEQALAIEPPCYGHIAVEGLTDFSPADVRFLRHLSKVNPVTVFIAPAQDDVHLKNLVTLFTSYDFDVVMQDEGQMPKRQSKALVTMGKQRLFRSLREVIDSSFYALEEIDVVFAQKDDSMDFARYLEMKGIGLHLGMRLPLTQTKIGQTLLSWIQMLSKNERLQMMESALHYFDDDAVLSASWVESLLPKWGESPAEVLQEILQHEHQTFVPLFSYDSMIEEKAIVKLHALLDEPSSPLMARQLKGANASRFFERLLEEHTVRSPENVHGVRLHTLYDRVIRGKHVIFVGFSKDYPQISTNVLIKKQLGADATEHLRQSTYARMQYQWRVANETAETTTFLFDSSDEEEPKEILPSVSPIVEPIREMLVWEKIADAWTCDYEPLELPVKPTPKGSQTNRRYSASAVNTFSKCPFQYWVKYVLHPVEDDEESYSLSKGNYMHEVLNRYYSITGDGINKALDHNAKPDFDSVAFNEATAQAIENHPEVLPHQEAIWKTQLATYITADLNRLQTTENARYWTQEHPFESHLKEGSPITIYGRVDRMDTLGDGVIIGDYKTGRVKTKAELKKLDDVQLQFYSMAHKQAPVYYGYLTDGQLQMIYGIGEESLFTETEWNDLLDGVIEKVETMDAQIQKGLFPATPDKHCKYCDYASICRKEVQDETE